MKKTNILSSVLALASISVLVADSTPIFIPLALAVLALIVFSLGLEKTKEPC